MRELCFNWDSVPSVRPTCVTTAKGRRRTHGQIQRESIRRKRAYLAALDELLLRCCVPIGRRGVLGRSDGLRCRGSRLFGCILTGRRHNNMTLAQRSPNSESTSEWRVRLWPRVLTSSRGGIAQHGIALTGWYSPPVPTLLLIACRVYWHFMYTLIVRRT